MTKATALSLTGVVLVLLMIVSVTIVLASPTTPKTFNRSPDSCSPVIIAHRGASGYVPEHTLGAYALAITMGADYVEPDLVITKDRHLVARHDNELGLTTDVAKHPEFAGRYRTQIISGKEHSGWFTEDFTLAEIKTLKAVERIPDIRPGNARMDGAFQIPTFQEIIDLVKSLQISQRRTIGIYPEIKYSSHFKNIGLPIEQLVVNTFHTYGYLDANAPVYIQSFEVNNLKELKEITNLRLLQLYESDKSLQPDDQLLLNTGLTYGNMSTKEGLANVAKYATAVGPDKSYIIPRNEDNSLGDPTSFVEDSHAVGLKVHPYTFRVENTFLPKEYQSDSSSSSASGDLMGELQKYIDVGIDGLFTDQPDQAVRLRGPCLYEVATSNYNIKKSIRRGPDDCKPLIVAHRDASGYVPEHTLGAYALAVTMGADYVEPDLVITRDGHLISRHENELSHTTDVATRPVFANRYRVQQVNGRTVGGWFSEDFTLAEVKTLRAIESIPFIRPGNARLDKAYDIPTFQEIIDLVQALEISENRTIGVYPELKNGLHFQRLGLAMEQKVVDIFHNNGYFEKDSPVYIQSFEVSNLKELKNMTNLRLLQLFGIGTPYDQAELGTGLTFASMATPEGLADVAKYATAVGPIKNLIIPRTLTNRLGKPTSFVKDAHAMGLQVHPWTFRAENIYLPTEFQRKSSLLGYGDLAGEIKAYLATGIDGLFVDQPDILVRIRGPCSD